MIHESDILCLHFYDFKMAFTGSEGNMRYRIVKAERDREDGEKESYLLATAWKGPYAYDHTEEEKVSKDFEFSNEGKIQAVAWLNEESAIFKNTKVTY